MHRPDDQIHNTHSVAEKNEYRVHSHQVLGYQVHWVGCKSGKIGRGWCMA